MYVKSKIERLCSIMQDQNYLTFIRAFMLKLDDAGEFMLLKKKLDAKRKAKAWQVLKQDWLLGRMGKSLYKRYEASLMQRVLFSLRQNHF